MTYLRPALVMLILLTLITGIAYPLLTTGLAQLLFPGAANGSLLYRGDKAVGSALIGQNFTRADYFWGRPSATGDSAYNPLASAGSNLAATNPALDKAIAERAAQLRQANPAMSGPIPVDLLTASGSGLDPQISIAAAQYQLARVAAARHLPPEQ
ncbi:potassium-transporting ATPase subunit KdpC, partial [Serratia marcescens]|nr:potassium-transporting ATPase subunit KdpC [Serratia marcescens]